MRDQQTVIQPGTPAPEFRLQSPAIGAASIQELVRGMRPALVVFFKTECPTCRLAFPFIERIWHRAQSGGEGCGFLGIGQNSELEIQQFFERMGATFPFAADSEPYEVSDRYGITNVPTLFLLDEHGVILRTAVGFSRPALEQISQEFLARVGVEAQPLFAESDRGVPVLQPG
ncbi:MAG: TlpA family protein disulfide reductase [Planctomycetes bacterium]|nr:TlpA family protein disulfide reductase [Planctomycetota bacterium]